MAFCRRHHLELSKVELFSFLIANQMQFEAKEPSHGAFASLGNTLEYFMDTYPLIPTYSQRSVVQETYAGAFPKQHFFDEQRQRDSHLFSEFYKTVVWNNLWEEMSQMFADFFQIEMFQTAVAWIVK